MELTEIKNKIKNLDSDSTVDDFREVIEGQQEAIEDLQEKTLAIITSSVRRDSGTQVEHSVVKDLFPALVRGRIDVLDRLGFKVGGFTDKGDSWTINTGYEKAALGTVLRGDATTGSYLMGTSYYNEVMRLAKQTSTMMDKVTRLNMDNLTLKVPKLAADLSLSWPSDQSSAKTESAPTFAIETLTAKTCAAWLAITDEFEDDAIVAAGQLFTALYAQAWGLEFDKQVLTANSDPFTGILYDSNVNELSMGSGRTSFSDITIDDLLNLQDQLPSETAHVGAYYIMHRSVFNIIRKLKDNNGNYIFQPASQGQPATIVSVPYILSDVMPDTGDDAEDTPFIIYGNPKYWLFGDRVGMEVKKFDSTVRAVDYDEIFYRFRVRAAFAPGIPSAFARLKTAAS